MPFADAGLEFIRSHYDIPKDAMMKVSEEVEDDGGYGCCHSYSSHVETTVYWEHIPEGKKRKVKQTIFYTGTVWELIQDIENNMPQRAERK